LRKQCDGVMVGKNTALFDNPNLKSDSSDDRKFRIIIDRELGMRENAEKFQAETRVQLTRIKLSQEHVRIKELEDEVLKLRIENARLTEMANQSESTRSGSESSGSSTNTQIVTAPHKLYTIFRTNSNLPNLTIPMYTVPWKRTRFTNIMFERYKEERGLKEISDFSNFDCQGRLFSGIYKVMQVDRSLTQRVLDDILKDIN